MKLISNWIISTIAIIITAFLIPGVYVDGLFVALMLAIVLAAINTFLRPLFILLTLPLTVLSLGLFVFIINALLVLLAAFIVPGFHVDGFWRAMLFAIVLAVINAVFNKMKREE